MKWEGKQGWGRAAGVRVVMGRAKLGTAGTSGVSGSGRAQLTPVEFMGGLAATSKLGQAGPGERVSVAPSPTHRCDFYVWSSNIITLPFPSPCFRNFERAGRGSSWLCRTATSRQPPSLGPCARGSRWPRGDTWGSPSDDQPSHGPQPLES